ncbi:MAG TPA: hypothetical protein VGH15_05435 [Caulobacteraceae bacterium]
MTIRTLNGTYNSTYTLSSGFTALSVTASGVVHGTPGSSLGDGGGDGVVVTFVAPVINSGSLFGGAGAGGYPGSSKIAPGQGGSGGTGADLTAGGYLHNENAIVGGSGGTGGGAPHGARGGYGGAGVLLGAAGTVKNSNAIEGGQGGTGGTGTYGGTGGTGGVGLSIAGTASVVSSGIVVGGSGGMGGTASSSGAGNGGAGGVGGAGIVLTAAAAIGNSGLIQGGSGGAGAAGVNGGANGLSGTGGDGVDLTGGGTLTNTGSVLGGSVGASVGFYGDGVRLAKAGRVVNGGATTTSALIKGEVGVYAQAGALTTLINFGTVAGLEAVELEGGGRVANGSASVTSALIAGGVVFGVGGVATLINFGTVDGYVTFDVAKDRLIAEPGSKITHSAGGAGTLELAGGAETITGMGPGGVITGGISMSAHDFATYQVDAAASLELTGVNQLGAGHSLIDNGGFGVASGASLTVANGGKVEVRGTVGNVGSIALNGEGSATELFVLADTTITGVGFVILSGTGARILGASASTILDIAGTVAGVGSIGLNRLSLTVDHGARIEANAAGNLTITTKSVTNLGIIESTAAGAKLVLGPQTINQDNEGEIYAPAGVIDLEDDVVIGGSVGSALPGLVYVTVGGGEFNGIAQDISLFGQVRVSNGSNVTLEGRVNDTGQINLFGGSSTSELIIGAAGVSLIGGGSVLLDNSANNRILGQAASDTLTNEDRITGAGQVGGGIMTLVNDAAGVILGNQTTALIIDTGANTITNDGLIEATGKGGVLVNSPVIGDGTLEAAGTGTLTFAKAVDGSGVGLINGGTLWAESTFMENVTFTGTTGVLKLAHSIAYTGLVKGLSAKGTNSLDLTDIKFTSGVTKATYSGTTTSGTLTVTDGTHTAHIKLLGDYLGSTFTVSSDTHGGTKVVDPASLAHAMAVLPAGSSAPAAATSAGALPPTLLLAHD